VKTNERLLRACVAATAALSSLSAHAEVRGFAGSAYKPVLVAESRSQELCESVKNRIFVATASGSECVAYWVTRGFEERNQAVFYMGGDYRPDEANNPTRSQAGVRLEMKVLQHQADFFRVRYVKIARLGIDGSSGNHGDRYKPHAVIVMNEAITLLKKRLGVKSIALAGQSGGSTLAASLLTLGRTDIACEILGSGDHKLVDFNYDTAQEKGWSVSKAQYAKMVYDPSRHVDFVARSADRRVFVIGDPGDQAVPFQYQWPFADQLLEAGHHARTIKVDILHDTVHHNATAYTWPAAGACLNGASDDEVVARVRKVENGIRTTLERKAMQQSASLGK
jgi:hypothetical protein